MTDIFWKTYFKAIITHNSFFPCFLSVGFTCCIIIKAFKLSNINLKDVLETRLTLDLYKSLLNRTKLTEMFFCEGQNFNAICFLFIFPIISCDSTEPSSEGEDEVDNDLNSSNEDKSRRDVPPEDDTEVSSGPVGKTVRMFKSF